MQSGYLYLKPQGIIIKANLWVRGTWNTFQTYFFRKEITARIHILPEYR